MDIDIYDTYARTITGDLLHFDVLLPGGEGGKAAHYAREWLLGIGLRPGHISLEQCRYCHTESAAPEVLRQISKHGYCIIPMNGCPAGPVNTTTRGERA